MTHVLVRERTRDVCATPLARRQGDSLIRTARKRSRREACARCGCVERTRCVDVLTSRALCSSTVYKHIVYISVIVFMKGL